MSTINKNYESFLKILIKQKEDSNLNSKFGILIPNCFYLNYKYNLFSNYEDSLDKEVRCPICLGRVASAVRPSKCKHVFCSFCLKKWMKSSDKCPYCRIQFKKIIRVDIQNTHISSQMDLFS